MQKTQAVFEAQLTNKLFYWSNCCIQMKVSISDHKIPKENKDTLKNYRIHILIYSLEILNQKKTISIKKKKDKIALKENNKLKKFCQKKLKNITAIILELCTIYGVFSHFLNSTLQSLPAAFTTSIKCPLNSTIEVLQSILIISVLIVVSPFPSHLKN